MNTDQPPKVAQTFLSAPFNDQITKTRRDLPHWKKTSATYWITFRLADALPQVRLRAWNEERAIWSRFHPQPWDEATWKEYDQRFGTRLQAWLDAGMGSRALARADVREAVKSSLLRFNRERLNLHAAVIMPNHVHALIQPLQDHNLSALLQGIKGSSARAANRILDSCGKTFWFSESYDHIVRSDAQFQHFVRYIAENPLKAHLRKDEFWLLEAQRVE